MGQKRKFIYDIILIFVQNYAPLIVKATLFLVFVIMGQIKISEWRIEKSPYSASSDLKLNQQIRSQNNIVRETQSICSYSCYLSKISLRKVFVSEEETEYLMQYYMVYGYDYKYKFFRDVISENPLYDQRDAAGDTSILIEEINSTQIRCRYYDISYLKEYKLNDTLQRFGKLNVNIDRFSSCIGHDRYGNVSWGLLLTFMKGQLSPCGTCLKELSEARDDIEEIWN